MAEKNPEFAKEILDAAYDLIGEDDLDAAKPMFERYFHVGGNPIVSNPPFDSDRERVAKEVLAAG